MEAATSAIACRPAGQRGSESSRTNLGTLCWEAQLAGQQLCVLAPPEWCVGGCTAASSTAMIATGSPGHLHALALDSSLHIHPPCTRHAHARTRGALAVDGVHRHAVGEARQEHGDAALRSGAQKRLHSSYLGQACCRFKAARLPGLGHTRLRHGSVISYSPRWRAERRGPSHCRSTRRPRPAGSEAQTRERVGSEWE